MRQVVLVVMEDTQIRLLNILKTTRLQLNHSIHIQAKMELVQAFQTNNTQSQPTSQYPRVRIH